MNLRMGQLINSHNEESYLLRRSLEKQRLRVKTRISSGRVREIANLCLWKALEYLVTA